MSVSTLYAQKVPQFGKDNIKDVIAAMTLEEKVHLVVGNARGQITPPDPAPGMVVRPQTGYEKIIRDYLAQGLSLNEAIEKLTASTASTSSESGRAAGAAGELEAFPRLGIPGMLLADGPAGLRIDPTRPNDENTYYCTAYPTSSVLAASWDSDLVQAVTRAMGNEVKEYGVDVLLAPAINIHRNPLCGRNFEYISEDPYLSGKTAAAYINGIQSNGVGVSLKHFAINNQETYRNGIDVHVTDRAMREIYLKGFEIAVKEAKPWTIMSSYNKINGVLASENKWLLTKVLRGEWGYDGFVMTDWWAEENGARQIAAGNDLLMPGTQHQFDEIVDAVTSGRLDEALLDKAVENILNVTLRSRVYQGYKYSNKPDLKVHAQIARQYASEGMVLLENRDNTLPFTKKVKKVALFGVDAYDILVGGSGSGNVNRAYKVNLNEGLTNAGYKLDEKVNSLYTEYVKNQKANSSENFWTVPVIPEIELIPEHLAVSAKEDDIALFVIGRMAGEGGDRKTDKGDWYLSDVEMANLEAVTEAFHAKGKKVVVLLNMGNIIDMSSWNEIPDAILHTWLAGQEAGNAIVDVLSGKVNPSGKLPMTIAKAYEDYPSANNFPFSNNTPSEVCYDEDIFVGYRYFDTKGIEPLYPFGYGKSYTTFEYSDLNVTPQGDGYKVTVTVKNTGKVAGKESVQIYSSAPKGRLLKPAKELKAYAKTALLKAGESQTLTMHIAKTDLGSWDERVDNWVCDPGVYTISAAASCNDVRLTATISL